MTKRSFFAFTLLGVGATFAIFAQPWLTITMSPNDKDVELGSFDGLRLYPWFNGLLILISLMALLSLYSGKVLRTVLMLGSALFLGLGSMAVAIALATSPTEAISVEIESAINVAAAHDLDPADVVYSWSFLQYGWSLAAITAAWFAYAAFATGNWQKERKIERSRSIRDQGDASAADPISLWESQK